MSFKTWKKEFYPRPANTRMSVRGAIEHSLRKWQGLSPRNLKKHGMEITAGLFGPLREINEIGHTEVGMSIDSATCALCQMYVDRTGYCDECPLFKSLGHRCDSMYSQGPYNVFPRKGPGPMIRALRATLRKFDAKTL